MTFSSHDILLNDAEYGFRGSEGALLRPAREQNVGDFHSICYRSIDGNCNTCGKEDWVCAADNCHFEFSAGWSSITTRLVVSPAWDAGRADTPTEDLAVHVPQIYTSPSIGLAASKSCALANQNHVPSLTSSWEGVSIGISSEYTSWEYSPSGRSAPSCDFASTSSGRHPSAVTGTIAYAQPSPRTDAIRRHLTILTLQRRSAGRLLRFHNPDEAKGVLRVHPVSWHDVEHRRTDRSFERLSLGGASQVTVQGGFAKRPSHSRTKRALRLRTALREYRERWRWNGDAWGWNWGPPWLWHRDRWRMRLATDVPAGLLVALVQLPHALAVARLCCVDAASGCRTAALSSLVYALLGPSAALAPGPSALVCLLTRDSLFEDFLVSIDHPFGEARVAAVTAVCACARFLLIATRLGPLAATAVSDAVLDALTVATALHAIAAALPHVVGAAAPKIHSGVGAVWYNMMEISKFTPVRRSTVAPGLALATFFLPLMSAIGLTPLFLRWRSSSRFVRHLRLFLPMEIMVLLAARAVAEFLPPASGQARLTVNMDAGLRPWLPAFDGFSLYTILLLFVTTLAALSQALQEARANHHSPVRVYKELVALCVCDALGCFFGCVPVAASPHASAALAATGARSQLANAVAGVTLLVALWMALPSPALADALPAAALAGILVFNVCGFFTHLADLKVIWKISKRNLIYWMVTFIMALVAGTTFGLLTGVMLQLIVDFFCYPGPPVMAMGKLDLTIGGGKKKVLFTELHKNVTEEVPGLKTIRIYGPINFSTRSLLRVEIFNLLEVNPEKIAADAEEMHFRKEPDEKIAAMIEENVLTTFLCYENSSDTNSPKLIKTLRLRSVIIDCTEPGIFDFSGVIFLKGLKENFEKIGVEVIVVSRIARISFYSEIDDALGHFLEREGGDTERIEE